MDHYFKLLKKNSLKVTPKRKAVIALFLKNSRHMGPYDVFEHLRKKIVPLGLPTVYRILEELCGIGILTKVPSSDRQLAYVLCRMPEEHHHHFVCRKCHKVEEVEYCNFEAISALIKKKFGGIVEQHSLHMEGLCGRCQ